MEKIKDMFTPGSKKEERTQETTRERGTTGGTTIGTAGYDVVGDRPYSGTEGYGTEARGQAYTTTTTTETSEAGKAAVCGRESFTKVEDRPVVIEHKETLKEHRPVDQEFVTETRFVGERPLEKSSEVIGVQERIVSEAQPKNPCD